MQLVVLRIGVVENEWQYRGAGSHHKHEESERPEDGAFDPVSLGLLFELELGGDVGEVVKELSESALSRAEVFLDPLEITRGRIESGRYLLPPSR